MFDDSDIDKYAFEEIPLDRDCFLMSEIYMKEYEEAMTKMLRGEECNPYEVGYVSPVAVRKINDNSLDLSWYANTHTRFHEVSITLPRDKVRVCVGCWQYDQKPYIFVDHEWLEQLHIREYSVFVLVDAIGVKEAIRNNQLTRDKLIQLRERIDELAESHKGVSFISFADSLILKSNWDVGYFPKGIDCSYRPETHPPMQLYLDEQFYHSLRFKFEFDKNSKPNNTYPAIMKSQESSYYYSTCDILIENLGDD